MTKTNQQPSKSAVVLSCNHELILNPEPSVNDLVYCHRCGEYRLVKGFTRAQAKCRHCSFSRMYGADDIESAKSAATRHIGHPKQHAHEVLITCRDSTIVISSLPTLQTTGVESKEES